MIKNNVTIGTNRTGTDLSPIDKKLLIEGVMQSTPSSTGDESAIETTRVEYLVEEGTIGSMPVPAKTKGVINQIAGVVKQAPMTVFLDKLGERLAFERTGARLYQTLLGKFDVSEPLPGGPDREVLERIQNEELEHFQMLREAMLMLGADPTAITPSADIAAVSSSGILQVVSDSRTNFKQSLEAILIAELTDNDGWAVLVELARVGGHQDLVRSFELAIMEEAQHLTLVRSWVEHATLAEAKVGFGTPRPDAQH